MALSKILHRLLAHPEARGLDLDAPESLAVHGRLMREKPFLRRLYKQYYGDFVAAARRAPPGGLLLEIGAGAGFLPRVLPGVTTLDIRPGAPVDLRASALALPLADGSVSCIFMLDVLHHLPDVEAFFTEAQRVLRPGGRVVMVEPFNSTFSRLVYTHLHNEPFNPEQSEWPLSGPASMSLSNQALPWIVFVRDRERFRRRFPHLSLAVLRPHTVLLYLLSGGLSVRALAPGALFGPLRRLEEALLPRWDGSLATMVTMELRKEEARWP